MSIKVYYLLSNYLKKIAALKLFHLIFKKTQLHFTVCKIFLLLPFNTGDKYRTAVLII